MGDPDGSPGEIGPTAEKHYLQAVWKDSIKDVKNRSGPCLHGTHDEVGTTKHNWSAQCQYNVTGWVSMWAYDMLSQ